jgi:hypothetical protein
MSDSRLGQSTAVGLRVPTLDALRLHRREFLHVLAGLAPLLAACRSETLETPPMPNSTEPSTPSPPPAISTDPFRLDDHMMGGALMATEPGPHGKTLEIHEWMTWLRVRSDEGVGVVVVTRREGDLPGQPVGLFRRRLDERQLAKLQQVIESIDWAKLPPPKGGNVLANHFAIEYQRGNKLIQRQFNGRNFEFIGAIQTYMEAVAEIIGSIGERPAGLVQVSVAATPDASDPSRRSLQLVIENPGTGSIVITDPRVPAAASAKSPRMYLRVAPANNGWSEPSWTMLPLPALPEGQSKTLVLPSKGKLEFAVPWQAPGPGTWWLQGAWIDYGGPIEPVADQQPLIPLLEDGPTPAMAGPYPVRGAAFAMGVSFDVQPTKP